MGAIPHRYRTVYEKGKVNIDMF